MGLMAGWRPLAHVDRSHLNANLELDDAGGLDVSFVAGQRPLAMSVSAAYVPMEEEHTGRDVDCLWLDAGLGVGTGPPGAWREVVFHATAGPSLLLMDFERGDDDTMGLGVFGRGGVGYCWGRLGMEVFGDLHGWLGTDSKDSHAAWAASLGLNAFFSF